MDKTFDSGVAAAYLLGINVGGIPGMGHPLACGVVLGACLARVVVERWWSRRRAWW